MSKATVKGRCECPECGSTQDLKHDGRKFFISCTDCGTLIHYQSKKARLRAENKLRASLNAPEEKAENLPERSGKDVLQVSGDTWAEAPERVPDTPEKTPKVTPRKIAKPANPRGGDLGIFQNLMYNLTYYFDDHDSCDNDDDYDEDSDFYAKNGEESA